MADNVIEFRVQAVDQFRGTFDKLANALGAVGKVAAVATAAMAAAGGTIFALTKHAANLQDQVQKLSDKLGIGVKELSEWSYAAQLADISQQQLGDGLQYLNRNLSEATNGNQRVAQAFRELGVQTTDAQGRIRTAAEVFPEVADRISQVGNAAKSSEIEMQLFGRSGVELHKILKDGSAGLQAAARDAEFLGVVMDKQATANAAAFNDSLTRIGQSLNGVAMAIGNELIPMMTGAFNQIADAIARNRESIKNWALGLIDAFLTTFVAIKQAIVGIFKFWTEAFSSVEGFNNFVENAKRAFLLMLDAAALALKSFSVMMVGVFKYVWQTFFELGKWYFMKLFDFMTGNDLADTLGDVLFKRVPEATRETIDEIRGVFRELVPEWAAIGSEMADFWSDAFGVSGESIRKEVEQLKLKFQEFAKVEQEETQKTVELSLEQRYKQHQEELKLLNERYTAQIFFAQSTSEVLSLAVEQWGANLLSINEVIAQTLQQTLTTVSEGFGRAVADAVVYGKSASESLKAIFKQTIAFLIQQLVQMGVQRLIFAAINKTAAATEGAANLASGLSQVYANSFASAAAIPFYGWAMAPGVASANLAMATTGAAAAMATGAGIGAMGAAHGGLTNVPREGTFLLDEGERVLSPRQNEDLTGFLAAENSGATIQVDNLTIQVEGSAFEGMSLNEIAALIADKFYPGMERLDRQGVRPSFMQRQRAR